MASDDLEKDLYKNWVRGAKGLEYFQVGLQDFVGDKAKYSRNQLLQKILQALPTGSPVQCNQCTSKNLLPEHSDKKTACNRTTTCSQQTSGNCFGSKPNGRRKCPNGICSKLYDAIVLDHSYKDPLWKNTDPSTWCSDPLGWSFAKCFQTTTGPGSSADTTDAAGLLSILINNLSIQNWLACKDMGSKTVCSFYKARDIRNAILHSPKLEIDDKTLENYLDTFVAVLQDSKCLATDGSAQNAVDKISQLKSKQIHISHTDETNLIKMHKEALSELREKTAEALQEISDTKAAIEVAKLDAIEQLNKQTTQLKSQALSEINEKKTEALKAFGDTRAVDSSKLQQDLDVDMKTEVEKNEAVAQSGAHLFTSVDSASTSAAISGGLGQHRPNFQSTETTRRRKEKEQSMKEDLISFFRRYHSTIPVAPLVEEHDAPLTDFYVQPPLTSVDVNIKFRSSQQLPKKMPIHSYRDLFLRGDGKMYNDIYVTAKAGVGKTSFAKKVCMTWCQAHNPNEQIKHKFKQDDLDAMRKFEFLFMVSLRDIETSECDLESMISSNLLNCLKRRSQYSRLDLEDVLNTKTCLLLVDGLDEWTHPTSCDRGYRDVHAIPHIPARENCTVMTTTRHWKFDVVKLGTSQIDRHVEVNELNKFSSKELISNAVIILNRQTLPNQSKTVEEFESVLSTLKLENLRYIPYILLQIICLWFDGKSIGRTKCEIYTNIITLTLSRGLIKLEKIASPPSRRQYLTNTYDIPLCLQLSDICKSHYDVLVAVAKLAFEKLFSSKAESNLVFGRSEVLCIISEDILKFCLEIGLLSQTKDYRSVSDRRSTLSFQHKSIQEYFAALYIQLRFDSEDIQERIRKECNTLPAILEMSNVFIFLAGLNSIACGHIFQIFIDALSVDETIEYFRNRLIAGRTYIPRLVEYWEIMKSWQSMLTDSAQEIITNNGKNTTPLYIEDIIIDNTITLDTCDVIKLLTENNEDKIKSMSISKCRSTEEFTEKLKALDLQSMHSLHKLAIVAVPEERDLCRLLSGSVDTLTCLALDYVLLRDGDNAWYNEIKEISTETVGILLCMDNLKMFSLENILLRHIDIKRLFQYLKNRQTMTVIRLRNIVCIDHGDHCEGYCLDLSLHQIIKVLELQNLAVSMLHVNSSSMEICGVGNLRPDVQSSLVQCLPKAKNLTSVSFNRFKPEQFDTVINTLSKLSRLESVAIQGTDLCDNALTLPIQMTNLELVFLNTVTMTSTSLRCLTDSVAFLPQQVTINLQACTVKTEKDYRRVKEEIRSSLKYKVEFDGLNKSKKNQFTFYKLAI